MGYIKMIRILVSLWIVVTCVNTLIITSSENYRDFDDIFYKEYADENDRYILSLLSSYGITPIRIILLVCAIPVINLWFMAKLIKGIFTSLGGTDE